MQPTNFQRIGSVSNAHVGNEFEEVARAVFAEHGITLSRSFGVPVGVGRTKKLRRFDLGSENPPVLLECKSHTWTQGGNIPSAKITVWNESMYYFHVAPSGFRKVLFVLKDRCAGRMETLASYYLRNYRHLVPDDVEFWEFDAVSNLAERIR